MGDTTGWSPDKVAAVAARLTTYGQASNALAVLVRPDASATVSLYVASGEGSANFDFKLDVTQAIGFFTPVVDGIRAGLEADGVAFPAPADVVTASASLPEPGTAAVLET